jgi:hypothetical protein
MEKYDFDGGAVRSLRKAITTYWLSMMTASKENGWRTSSLDPAKLLDYFGSLRLKTGFALRAYECHQELNSWGVVYAMPVSATFPEPVSSAIGRPLRPQGALDDVMEAIEGDGTAYSYLCASLLARELEQFATIAPDNVWLNCLVLDGDPWNGANGMAHALAGQGFKPELRGWYWQGQQPDTWRPAVFMNGQSVTVRFHTFSGLGRQRIITFEDRYVYGSYKFSRHEKAMANGPDGYIW